MESLINRFPLLQAAVAYFSSHQASNLIVNAVGADRPGIVSDITRYVTDSGGNVGRSQAARLGDYFSLIMQVQVPSTQVDSLKQSLTSMPGMNASIFETADIKPPGAAATPTIACKTLLLGTTLLFNRHPSSHTTVFLQCV